MSMDNDDLTDLRDGLATIACQQRAADTLERATKYAHDIVTWLHRDHYADNAKFEPFDDILGLLSQIDNMICGWKEPPAAVAAVPDAAAIAAEYIEAKRAVEGTKYKHGQQRTWRCHDPEVVRLRNATAALERLAATPAPVAQKVPKDVAKGWKCHCCGFDGTENQPYNRFCVQCRRSR